MNSEAHIIAQWAAALDADDFDAARALLAPDAAYVMRDETLRGADAILGSYRDATRSAHATFDEVRYRSEVVRASGRAATIRFHDELRAGDRWLHHACEQDVELDADGRVARIVHRDLPGERERLIAFLDETGRELP